MTKQLRSLAFGITALLCGSVFAQPAPPYDVTVWGYVSGCTPNSFVNIQTVQNTQPSLNIDVPLAADCSFSIDLSMDSFQGWFQVSTPCNGVLQTEVGSYTINSFDSTSVYVMINCGSGATDCLGVPGGPAVAGTACNTALGLPGTWSAACNCVANNNSCQACFTVAQSGANPNGGGGIPWSMSALSCTTGGVPPYTYLWALPNGSTSSFPEVTYAFSTAGAYTLCLTIADANGCTSTTCDSVLVDDNGVINGNPIYYDCLGVANGPNVSGSSCTLPGTNEFGTWSAACVCVPDSSNTACQAGFFAMQAYQWVDSAGNPNGGGGTPVPNELWIWNLSGGGTGNYQFLWNFGDGTSSTEAFPSHTYSSGSAYLLCLTVSDNAGCTDTYCDSISVDGDGLINGLVSAGSRSTFTINVMNPMSTGVQESSFSDLGTWPNPVEDVLNMTLSSELNGKVLVNITDLSGRVVSTTSRAVSNGQNRMTMPVNELVPGMYLVQVTNGSSSVSSRFVKVR